MPLSGIFGNIAMCLSGLIEVETESKRLIHDLGKSGEIRAISCGVLCEEGVRSSRAIRGIGLLVAVTTQLLGLIANDRRATSHPSYLRCRYYFAGSAYLDQG